METNSALDVLPNVPLPTRNTLRQAQGNAFTGQYSYISDDATDLGSSGFGLMFYREASRAVLWRVDQSRWYTPNEYKCLVPIEDLMEPAHLTGWVGSKHRKKGRRTEVVYVRVVDCVRAVRQGGVDSLEAIPGGLCA